MKLSGSNWWYATKVEPSADASNIDIDTFIAASSSKILAAAEAVKDGHTNFWLWQDVGGDAVNVEEVKD